MEKTLQTRASHGLDHRALVKRIKFLSKTPLDRMAPLWESLFPSGGYKNAAFIFDPDERDYDFLVVYEDLPPLSGERKILRSERLACPKKHTLLITTEPSSIRIDGLNYLSQFGEVWTSRPLDWKSVFYLDRRGCRVSNLPTATPDPLSSRQRTLYQQRLQKTHPPPLRWFYGRDMEGNDHLTLDELSRENSNKTRNLSTVTSNKAMKHTVHAKRLEFVTALKARLGDDLSLYGRGFKSVRDKREAMSAYRYHIAIENHVQSGHYTEKLTDCFLALCLPFYFGAPDYDRYFPREAAIPIDLFALDKSESIIREAIASNQYEKRLPSLQKAKEIAIGMSNPLFRAQQWAERIDEEDATKELVSLSGENVIHGRHAFRRAHPIRAVQDAAYRARMKRHRSSAAIQQ